MKRIPGALFSGSRKYFLLAILLLAAKYSVAQKFLADSLTQLLSNEKTDSGRAKLMSQLADAMNVYNPDSALSMSQQAYYLSTKIKYTEGESMSMGAMANAFSRIGNYPRALYFYLQKLKTEEKRNIPGNLASVLIDIGTVYVLQEEYPQALSYYAQADSVIELNNLVNLKYYIELDLGDAYDRLDKTDSAYKYFEISRQRAIEMNDDDFIATSMTGLAHSYRKMGNYEQSFFNYRSAITGLTAAKDDEVLCEASLGLAKLFQQLNKNDSAALYAYQSLAMARKDNLLSAELQAATFLTNLYRIKNNMDSAFAYVKKVQELNDTLNSKTRIREAQVMATNEQLRQLEIEENKKTAARERHEQLQILFIGMFVPGLFLLTLLFSRIKMHKTVIRIMGVLSLLVLFEYITLLLHPYVEELTGHAPVLEILIFVAVAAIVIPAHHRIEHWLIEKLTFHKKEEPDDDIRLNIVKVKMKDVQD